MAGARPILIRAIIVGVFLLAVWLLAGRSVSMLLDVLFTLKHESLPLSPLSVENGTLWIGEVPLSTSDSSGKSFNAVFRADDASRLVFSMSGKSFGLGTLGATRKPVAIYGGDLTPDPGDEVTLTVRRSFMSWPTPFDMNFMTGHSPSWKRHLYYRLQWKKRSGARLEMVWRYEQWYYGTLGGWSNGIMTGPGTGMISCKIDDASGK